MAENKTKMAPATEPVTDTPVVKVRERPKKQMRRDFADAKDPSLHVKLVRDTNKRISYHKRLGYEVAKEDMIADHDGYTEADNTVHFGDRVAMVCRKDDMIDREIERIMELRGAENSDMGEAEAMDGYQGEGLHTYREHGKNTKSFIVNGFKK